MAIEALNERSGHGVLLSKFEGMSYAEIAEIMEMSPQRQVVALAGTGQSPRSAGNRTSNTAPTRRWRSTTMNSDPSNAAAPLDEQLVHTSTRVDPESAPRIEELLASDEVRRRLQGHGTNVGPVWDELDAARWPSGYALELEMVAVAASRDVEEAWRSLDGAAAAHWHRAVCSGIRRFPCRRPLCSTAMGTIKIAVAHSLDEYRQIDGVEFSAARRGCSQERRTAGRQSRAML